MDEISRNILQMATTERRPTAPGHPERGSQIDIDGVTCTVSSSVRIAGRLVIYALDAAGNEHSVRLSL